MQMIRCQMMIRIRLKLVLEINPPPFLLQLMFYWVGVTEAVKNWIKACAFCQSRVPADPPEPPVRFCLAYGCDASSYVYPELSFHRSDMKDADLKQCR